MMEKMKARMKFRMMMESIDATRPEEFGCDDCFSYMEEYAEFNLNGGGPHSERLSLVADHLNKCMDCGEIYEIFIKALKKGGK